jgi:8-oxo-dGTP diphosphatase
VNDPHDSRIRNPYDGPVTTPGPLRQTRRIGAYGVIRDGTGRVLLTRSSDLSDVVGTWYLPGGGVEHGEDPAAGVLRELYEESGQVGRVVELLGASGRHNPRALGPEGYPMDWHSVRVVYRVAVDEPTPPRVLDVGGSTVRSGWFERADIAALPVTDVVDWALSV